MNANFAKVENPITKRINRDIVFLWSSQVMWSREGRMIFFSHHTSLLYMFIDVYPEAMNSCCKHTSYMNNRMAFQVKAGQTSVLTKDKQCQEWQLTFLWPLQEPVVQTHKFFYV